eukprot:7135684-Ditylum_brightwellii.AAC.1
MLDHNNDPGKMLDDMELIFNHIQNVSDHTVFTKKNFIIHVFCALLMTTNQDFKCYILGKKDAFDKGLGVNIFSIISAVWMYYTNNKASFNAVDPKYANIIALATKLQTLKKQ